jgi:hypothetical protein
MTTTTTNKPTGRNPQERPDAGAVQQDLQAAHYAHTLAHLLYGQLAATYPWIHPYALMHGVPAPMPMQMPAPMTMAPGMAMYGPMGPQPTVPWMQGWNAQCCSPMAGQNPAGSFAGPGFFGPEFIPR